MFYQTNYTQAAS